MNKLYVLFIFIALVVCMACQRQQSEKRKNVETQRQMEQRLAEEHQAQEQEQVTEREPKLNAGEKPSEMILMPASSVSPSASPENPHALKSQAQRFQPRRIVPMTSPITATPTPTPTPSER